MYTRLHTLHAHTYLIACLTFARCLGVVLTSNSNPKITVGSVLQGGAPTPTGRMGLNSCPKLVRLKVLAQ